MNITCPHCSQVIEVTPEVHAQIQDQPHLACPTCQGLMAVPPMPASAPKQSPQRPVGGHKAVMQAQHGLNRNMLVLGVTVLLLLGGLAAFLASRNGGSVFNIFQNTTNQIIHNSYFTQLIASGVTTEKDLKAIGDIRPYGDGFIGISKEPLAWEQARDLARRTGAEVLPIEDDAAGTKLQLTDWLNIAFAQQLDSTVWVRQDGQPKVLDKRDVLSVTALESPRKTALQWKPNSGRTTRDPILATKEEPFENSLSMKFVPMPITGGPTDGKMVLFSVWETRVLDYERFVNESAISWQRAEFLQESSHPAVNVSWYDAEDFCAWLTARAQKSGQLSLQAKYRLPSDHEWSCAVGIGNLEKASENPEEKQLKLLDEYPWGSIWPPPPGSGNYSGEETVGSENLIGSGAAKDQWVLNGYRDPFAATAPVGSFAMNRFGLYDIGGNAWEWCKDSIDPANNARVLRGGAWYRSERRSLRSSIRHRNSANRRYRNNGFRVVLEIAQP